MKTLTIHVREGALLFDIPGVRLDWHCPMYGSRRWWRGWNGFSFSAAATEAPKCVLKDVLERGVTDVKIVLDVAGLPTVRQFACDFYDAVAKVLASPPEGTKSYHVALHDVKDCWNSQVHPATPFGWIARSTTFNHVVGPEVNLQNIPRRTPEGAKLRAAFAAPYGANPQVDIYAAAWKSMSEKTDYEKLEARVAALEASRRADWWAFRRHPGFIGTMYGGSLAENLMQAYGARRPGKSTLWNGISAPFPTTPAPKTEPDYRKMVLRIGFNGVVGLCHPEKALSRAAAPWVFGQSEAAKLAAKLRELKVRELTLRRKTADVSMERMTEWLVALVNEHAPVMKIISDPEPLK